jgi:hypothetical protein
MSVNDHPMSRLKGTAEAARLMALVRAHKNPVTGKPVADKKDEQDVAREFMQRRGK